MFAAPSDGRPELRARWQVAHPPIRDGCHHFDVPDLEETMQDLRSRGVVFEEYDFPGLKTVNGIADMGGERSAWFKDPDGNILNVVNM